MIRSIRFLLALFLVLWKPLPPASAQSKIQSLLPSEIQSEEAGQALAARLRHSRPEENTCFRATLKTRSQDGSIRQVPLQGQILLGLTNWQTIYVTEPTEGGPGEYVLIRHYPDQSNQYFLGRPSSELALAASPGPLTAGSPDHALAGSNFWLVDLAMGFLHWSKQLLVKTEMRKGRWCHVLESQSDSVSSAPYSRVLCWLDKETGQPLLAEAYDQQNQLLKEFSIGSLKKVQGQWQVRDIKISNVQTRSRTWLEFDLTGSDQTVESH